VNLLGGAGTVTMNSNGTLTFTPAPNHNGEVSFDYTIDDGRGGSSTATVTINVQAVNDAPVPAQTVYEVTTEEDKAVSGAVEATDVEGDELTYALGDNAAHGTVTVNSDGTWTYVPNADFYGEDSFTVVISDGNGGQATSTVKVTVTPVNDDPVAAQTVYEVTTEEDKAVNGAVEATDVEGDELTYALGDNAAHGMVTVNSDGTWTYVPNADFYGEDTFTVVVSDGNGGQTTSTVKVTVTPVNDAPQVGAVTETLSESGLLEGDVVAQGKLAISDVDEDDLTVTLSAPAGTGITSGGVAVIWSGTGTQDDPLVGTAGGKQVLVATIDADGNYTVTLKAPIDHTGEDDESKTLEFIVSVNDGTVTSTGKLTVTIEDDAPSASPVTTDLVLPEQDTNVLLILDISLSMKSGAGSTENRLPSMREAAMQLLAQYDVLGDVAVRIVVFGRTQDTQAVGSTWMSVADAISYISNLDAPSTGTDYEAALWKAMDAYEDPGKIGGARTVAYFISDGEPSQGSIKDNGTVTNNVVDEWTSFLTEEDIVAFSFGIGSSLQDAPLALNHIAFDGASGTDTDAVVVRTPADLPPILRETVGAAQAGNLFTAGTLDTLGAGADGGHVASVTVNGVTYAIGGATAGGTSNGTWKADTSTWVIQTLGPDGQIKTGGVLIVNMQTGEYTYLPALAEGEAHIEQIQFVIEDADGDSPASTLTISVHPAGTDLGGDVDSLGPMMLFSLPALDGVDALAFDAPEDDKGAHDTDVVMLDALDDASLADDDTAFAFGASADDVPAYEDVLSEDDEDGTIAGLEDDTANTDSASEAAWVASDDSNAASLDAMQEVVWLDTPNQLDDEFALQNQAA